MIASLFVVNAQIRNWNEVPGCLVGDVPTLKCLEPLFGNILTAASTLTVLILFIMFIIGAFGYLTSFGNPEKIKKAQGTFKFALAGFAIFISAYLILNIICFVAFNEIGASCKLFHFQIGGP